MTVQYSIPSGSVALPSAAARGVVTMTMSANVPGELISLDVASSYLTTATPVSLLIEVVTCSAVGTGGAAFTPRRWGQAVGTSATAARTGDITTDVTSPVVQWSPGWIILPGGPFSYPWPLGREQFLTTSTIYAVRLTASAAISASVTAVIEE